MENNGQFLLYDALLTLVIVLIFLAGILMVLSTMDNTLEDSNEALDRLSLLAGMEIHSNNLLLELSWDDEEARALVLEVLSDDSFTLKDLTNNRLLLEKNPHGTRNVSARKIVGGHEFELILYD